MARFTNANKVMKKKNNASQFYFAYLVKYKTLLNANKTTYTYMSIHVQCQVQYKKKKKLVSFLYLLH